MGHLVSCSTTFYCIPFISWNRISHSTWKRGYQSTSSRNSLVSVPNNHNKEVRNMNSDPLRLHGKLSLPVIYLQRLIVFQSPICLNQVAIRSHLIYSVQKVEQLRFQKACKLLCLLLVFLTMTRNCYLETFFCLGKGLTAFLLEKGCDRIFVWRQKKSNKSCHGLHPAGQFGH